MSDTEWNNVRDEGVPGDRGQAIGLVLMSVALVAMIATGIAGAAARLTERSRAQNAADAAALAGVTGGASAAGSVAARNGGLVITFAEAGNEDARTVTVEVVVGDEHAIARASNAP
jgi:Flp pilus assembly protein TadG